MSDSVKLNNYIQNILKLLNRKWVLAILADLYNGNTQFSDFLRENKNLNNNVLSDTLKFMEENGLIIKKTEGINTSYHLTQKSENMNDLFYELGIYGIEELTEDADLKKKFNETFNDIFH